MPDIPYIALILIQIAAGWNAGVYVAIFVHELAHALAAKWYGYDVTSFGMGVSRPLLVFNLGNSRAYICRDQPHVGITFWLSPPGHKPTKAQQIVCLAAGSIADLMLILLTLAAWIWLDWGAWFWGTATVINTLVTIPSLIPGNCLHANVPTHTDAGHILNVLRDKEEPVSAMDRLLHLHHRRRLWQEVDDRRMEAAALGGAAGAWSLLGDLPHGRELSKESEAVHPQPASITEAEALLEQGKADKEAGRFTEAEEACRTARQIFAAGFHLGGEIAAIYGLAAVAEARGQVEAAEALFKEVEMLPLVARSSYYTALAWRARLEIAAKRLSMEQIAALQSDYDKSRVQGMPDDMDWAVYQQLARQYIERECWEQAEEPALRACQAAGKVWQAMPTPENRQRFAAVAAEFQKQTGELLTRLGKPEAAAELGRLFTEAAEKPEAVAAKEAADLARQQREKTRYRRGLILTGFNGVVCVLGFVGMTLIRPDEAEQLLPTKVLGPLALFAVFQFAVLVGSGFYQVLYFVVRSSNSNQQESPGSMTLALAVIPWIVFSVLVPLLYFLYHS